MGRSRGGRGGRRYDRDMRRYLAVTQSEDDSGYGTIGNSSMYHDSNPDGSTNVFPEGMPRGVHHTFPHDKMIIEEDGEVSYFRENGETIMDSRDYRR